MTKSEVETRILDLKQDLVDASLAYDVWREFTSANNRDAFEGAMGRFPRYFEATIHSSLVTVVVTCYRLFEDRRDTANFPQLLRDLAATCASSNDVTKKTSAYSQEILPTWKKVSILRNNVFGHRSKKINPVEAFQKAKITPDQLRDLIKNMRSLLNLLSRETCGRSFAFNRSARREIGNFMALIGNARANNRIGAIR
jgi:hypothetical protein